MWVARRRRRRDLPDVAVGLLQETRQAVKLLVHVTHETLPTRLPGHLKEASGKGLSMVQKKKRKKTETLYEKEKQKQEQK